MKVDFEFGLHLLLFGVLTVSEGLLPTLQPMLEVVRLLRVPLQSLHLLLHACIFGLSRSQAAAG